MRALRRPPTRDRGVVVGQGWDERAWPDPRPPDPGRADRGRRRGRPVYLARVDVHSAVVSTGLLERLPDVGELAGYRADGWLTQDAHHACRGQMDRLFSDAERRAAARAALRPRPPRGRHGARAGRPAPRAAGGPGPRRRGGGGARAARWSPTGASWPAGRARAGARRSAPPGSPATSASTAPSARVRRPCASPTPTPTAAAPATSTDDEIADHLVACTERGPAGRVPLHRRRRGRRGGPGAPPRPSALGWAGASGRPGTGWSTSRWSTAADLADAGRARRGGQCAARRSTPPGAGRGALRAAARPARAGDDEPVRLDLHRAGVRARLRHRRPGHPARRLGDGTGRRAALRGRTSGWPSSRRLRGATRGGHRAARRRRRRAARRPAGRPTWPSGTCERGPARPGDGAAGLGAGEPAAGAAWLTLVDGAGSRTGADGSGSAWSSCCSRTGAVNAAPVPLAACSRRGLAAAGAVLAGRRAGARLAAVRALAAAAGRAPGPDPARPRQPAAPRRSGWATCSGWPCWPHRSAGCTCSASGWRPC